MKSQINRIIIQFLVLTLLTMGTSMAAGSLCQSGCASCGSTPVASCCDDMAGAGHIRDAQSEHRSPIHRCSNDEICLGKFEHIDVLGVQPGLALEIGGDPAKSIILADLSECSLLLVDPVPSPPDRSLPSLYLTNCCFLI